MSRNFDLLRQTNEGDPFGPALAGGAGGRAQEGPKLAAPVPRVRDTADEEFLTLVQRLFLSPAAGSAPRVVLFAGAGKDESSTAICCGTAEVLADQTSGGVCLVDANLRAPAVHDYFGVGAGRGLSEALLEAGPIAGFVRRTAGNVSLMSAGFRCDQARLVPRSTFARQRFQELRALFEFVLVDLPPVAAHPDATVLAPFSDGVVLVLEADHTRRETVRDTHRSLIDSGGRVLGAALNNRTFPIPDALYRWL